MADWDSIVPLDENNQFYLHFFGAELYNFDTLVARVNFEGNQSRFEFWYKNCSDFDGMLIAQTFSVLLDISRFNGFSTFCLPFVI